MESDFTTKEIISKEILLKAYTQMMLAKSNGRYLRRKQKYLQVRTQ